MPLRQREQPSRTRRSSDRPAETAALRLLLGLPANRAGIHVDFETDGQLDDLRSLPGHFTFSSRQVGTGSSIIEITARAERLVIAILVVDAVAIAPWARTGASGRARSAARSGAFGACWRQLISRCEVKPISSSINDDQSGRHPTDEAVAIHMIACGDKHRK
jgi:hypothetical protein